MTEKFNVVLIFPDESSHYEQRYLGEQEAVDLALECTGRPAAVIGMIARIIITDMLDVTVFEWKYREGVVFPTKEQIEEATKIYGTQEPGTEEH